MKKNPPKLLALPRKSLSVKIPEEILCRREEAFRLRVEEGKTLPTIAKELGVAVSTIHEDLKTIAKMKFQGMIEKDELLLARQNHTIDKLLEKWIPLAASEDLVVGETRTNNRGDEYDILLPTWESTSTATDKVIKLLDHQAKINGLASPKEKSPEEIGTTIVMSVMEAFRKMTPKRAEVIDG